MKIAGIEIGPSRPLILIAGPCVLESESLALGVAEQLARSCARLSIPLIFKASFRKANRSSLTSFSGPGFTEGLRILQKVKRDVGVAVLTDVHEDTPLDEVAEVVDVLQTPALLCRQTRFILGVARTGRPVNLKKGQFLSPWEMANVVEKARSTGNERLLVCERGAAFGYNDLVADMRSIAVLRETGCPVIFDASHAVQRPGALGSRSGGEREHIPLLARAAVAAGIAGLFIETHPDPDRALSDGPNAWPLQRIVPLLEQLQRIDQVVKATPYLENELLHSPSAEPLARLSIRS